MKNCLGDKFLPDVMTAAGFSFLLVFFLSACLLTTPVLSDQRLELFTQQFENLEDEFLPLAHPDNPFNPYLEKHFEEGLEDDDKEELYRLQEKGDCYSAVQLVIKGFTQLYPFLKPIFMEKSLEKRRGFALEFVVMSGYKPSSRRCTAYSLLNDLLPRRRLEEFPPIDFDAEFNRQIERFIQRKAKTDHDKMYRVIAMLGRLAFCFDYPPAIRDIRKSANNFGGMFLTAQEELYLIERADLQGLLNGSQYQKAIDKIRKKFSSPHQFSEIRTASRQSKFVEIDKIKSVWHRMCK